MFYLRNAELVDGTGKPPFVGGLLMDGDRIVKLCDTAPDGFGGEVVDCTGLTVTPGFIDAHSHNDWFALRDDAECFFKPFLQQGITSFVTGNCGLSTSGFAAGSVHEGKIGGGLFSLDGNRGVYPRMGDWLAAVDGGAPGNVAALAGHGSARIGVSGMSAEPLDGVGMEAMLRVLEQSLQDGACGVSLGLMYEPGIYAPRDELVEVARLVKRYNRVLTVHPKAMSRLSLSYGSMTKSHLMLALEELADIVRETGVDFQYSHLLFVGARTWGDEPKAIKALEALAETGSRVLFDMYPLHYGASVISVILPEWYMKLTPAQRQKPLTRAKLAVMIQATSKLLGFGFDDITIAYADEGNEDMQGKTVAQLAVEWNISKLQAYLKICEASDFKARVLQGKYQNRDIVKRLMRHDMSLFMTDAWVESSGVQNGGIYGAFPLFWQLADEAGLPIETAVAKMTGRTAARFGLKDRGVLREGAFADVTVVDRKALRPRIDEALPPLGVEYVFVNGQAVVRKGEFIAGQRPGRAIRAE